MKKIIKRIKKKISEASKMSLIVYSILRILVIICMIREIYHGNIENALLCVLSLVLFLLPSIFEEKFRIDLPTTLEVSILLFIFSAEILGTINDFYGKFPMFDDILHTLNGFLAASFGFSLVYLLNENIVSFKLSPIFVSLVAFCFSMTIGIVWEFYEYSLDYFFDKDTQNDSYVYKINSGYPSTGAINIDDIDHTIIYDKNNKELVKIDGYLDIGLHDTMHDLIVNFVGAFVFSVFGYLYIIKKDKYKVAGIFLTRKKDVSLDAF